MPNQTDLSGFDRLPAQVFAHFSTALMDIGTDLEGQGRMRAPVDEGFLRQSIHNEGLFRVAQAQGRSKRMVVRIAARMPYALVQHENTKFKHPKGGEAKYLSRPMAERMPRYRALLARAMEQALKAAAVA